MARHRLQNLTDVTGSTWRLTFASCHPAGRALAAGDQATGNEDIKTNAAMIVRTDRGEVVEIAEGRCSLRSGRGFDRAMFAIDCPMR